MSRLTQSRTAQTPLVQEYVFVAAVNTVVDTAGAVKNFSAFSGASSNPLFPAFRIPVGAIITGGDVSVEVAYVGPTAATLSIGDSGSATRYANAVNLLVAARTPLTLPASVTGGLDIVGQLALTVANATAGQVRVRVMYTIDGRGTEVA